MSKRIYPRGTYEVFDREYDSLMVQSQICNGAGKTIFFSQNLGDRQGLQIALNQLIGTKDGSYYFPNGDRWVTAIIPQLKAELAELEENFLEHQRRRVREGYKKPENTLDDWPVEFREKRLLLEARLSVNLDEVSELERRLKDISEKVETEDLSKILQYRLRGSGRLRDGQLVEIDGCKVEMINNRLIITQGAFRGMQISDYKNLVEQYYSECRRRDAEKLLQLQAQAKSRGLPPVSQFVTPLKRVSPNSLPGWPQGIRNYITDPEVEESSLLTRKRKTLK